MNNDRSTGVGISLRVAANEALQARRGPEVANGVVGGLAIGHVF
jgi:hypothetical protein